MKEQEETLRKAISYCIDFYDNKEATNRIMQFIKDDRALQLLQTGVSNSLPSDDYWETRCKLMEQVEENNPCDPDINQEQIEAWNKYHNFIKERGQRQ